MTMTVDMVPGASIAGMVFSLIVSFALPIGLFVYAKKKLGAKTAPFFIGCGVFFVMVLMLEAAIHRIVFQLAGEADVYKRQPLHWPAPCARSCWPAA